MQKTLSLLRRALLGLVAATGIATVAQAQGLQPGAPWVADLGDGRYRNPVLHTDYSDPDVIRVGERFYMTASSFTNVPGLPLLESPDLVNWTLVGHALPELVPRETFGKPSGIAAASSSSSIRTLTSASTSSRPRTSAGPGARRGC
jgi:hypothetical protein